MSLLMKSQIGFRTLTDLRFSNVLEPSSQATINSQSLCEKRIPKSCDFVGLGCLESRQAMG